jgi:hypothetical protein
MKFVTNLSARSGLSLPLLLPLFALACGSSSPKPAAPAEPAPVAAAPPPAPEPAPAKPATPEPPPIPEAPPPTPPGPPKPHVAKALAFLPPDAQAVIGFDVPRIASTPLGDKFRQAFLGASLPKPCESLTAGQFGNIVVGAAGGGKVVVVLDGKLPERGMVACLEAGVKTKGAKAEIKTVAGHKFHYVTGSSDDNGWITWTKNAVVMANSEAALTQALDAKAGKLAGDLAQLSLQVDHGHMVWGAGIIPAAHLAALGLSADVVGGPVTVRASVDIAGDTDIDVVLGCATPDAATVLANAMRPLVGQLRSAPNTAPLVASLKLGVHGKDIHAMAKLDAELTRKLIEAMNVK